MVVVVMMMIMMMMMMMMIVMMMIIIIMMISTRMAFCHAGSSSMLDDVFKVDGGCTERQLPSQKNMNSPNPPV